MDPRQGGWLIAATLLLALVLSAFSLPLGGWQWLAWLCPSWALALFFFWTVAAPGRTGMFSAWCVGLLFDALAGGSYPFGVHGIGFAFAVFIAARLRERLRLYGAGQRMLVLLAVAVVAEAFTSALRVALLDRPFSWLMLAPALTTAALYPLLEAVLRPLAGRFTDRNQLAGGRRHGW